MRTNDGSGGLAAALGMFLGHVEYEADDGPTGVDAQSNGSIAIASGTGAGAFRTPAVFSPGGSLELVDLDADGACDVVASDSRHDRVLVFLNRVSSSP